MKNKKKLQKEEVSNIIHDKNFLIGLTAFIILLIIGGMGITKYMRNLNASKVAVVSPSIVQEATNNSTDAAITPSVTDSAMLKASSSANTNVGIKELPNTTGEEVPSQTGENYYTVGINDNFWKISKRMCGTGVYYLSIKQYNGYQNQTLRPGDVLTVVCSQ